MTNNSEQLFQQWVMQPVLQSIQRCADQNAFCIDETFYTYRQFGEHIAAIAADVNKLKRQETYLGLVVNDDIETYSAIFALWLQGKAYVPLHPNQPLERCLDIVEQMGISNILDSSESSRFNEDAQVIALKNSNQGGAPLLDPAQIGDDTAAYILFTSGSTGKPKGVEITRRNVGAFMDSFWSCGIQIDQDDKCLQCFDLTFDVSVQSFLVPLSRGACVFTVPHHEIKYSYVSGLMEDHKLTFGAVAPSMLRYLRPYFDEIDLPDMKHCILTAEASPFELAREWQACVPSATLYDFYGPTEATIYCTWYQIPAEGKAKTLNGMLSIGKPLKHVTAIIIDEAGNEVEPGEQGELCVAGNQITCGYWQNPEKNAASFFEKEHGGSMQRFYRTGDLCYADSDGDLMLYGRIDSQIKIQGYRVELGEIEFHAREFLNGANAVALPFQNASGNNEIALFIEGNDVSTTPLVAYLKSRMPSYMIPTQFLFEDVFALNANSKVDKIKLKEKLPS